MFESLPPFSSFPDAKTPTSRARPTPRTTRPFSIGRDFFRPEGSERNSKASGPTVAIKSLDSRLRTIDAPARIAARSARGWVSWHTADEKWVSGGPPCPGISQTGHEQLISAAGTVTACQVEQLWERLGLAGDTRDPSPPAMHSSSFYGFSELTAKVIGLPSHCSGQFGAGFRPRLLPPLRVGVLTLLSSSLPRSGRYSECFPRRKYSMPSAVDAWYSSFSLKNS